MISRRTLLGAALLTAPAFSAARAQAPAARPNSTGPSSTGLTAGAPTSPAPSSAARISAGDAQALIVMLQEAPTHGLPGDPTRLAQLHDRLGSNDPSAREELRRLAIGYAAAQHGQRIPLDKFDPNWGMKPQPYAALLDFDFAVTHDRVRPWIDSQPPPFARYRTLRDALVTYGRLQDKGWGGVPAGPDLAPGATGARVRALRARISFEEGVPAGGKQAGLYDPVLVGAVKRFQTRHGIAPTGVVGASTLRALNATPAQRVDQIRANLERWRWVPRDRAASRIEVNIASAVLQLYEQGAVADTMLAAPGRPNDQTPLLVSEIGSIVLNPAWHVPKSIADKELLRKGGGYLRSHGFSYVADNPGAPLIQKPGPHNALGRIKFDFPNGYSVYLHDTPGQAAFSRASRNVSHGCVRLQHPEDLAERLLAPNNDWPLQRINTVLATTDTTRVPLSQPMPVMLTYWTAFSDGPQMAFREDIYGWDAKVLNLLKA